MVSVKDNLAVNIDRCIHTDKISKHDNGVNFYFNICMCMLFKMGYLAGQRNLYLIADDGGIPKEYKSEKKLQKTLISVSRLRLAVAICLFIRISVINLINHPSLSSLISGWPDGNHGQNVLEAVPPSRIATQWHKALANDFGAV